EDARDRIIQLGERPQDVYLVGCPRIDLVASMLAASSNDALAGLFDQGVGDPIDLDGKFLLVSQHPVTTEYGEGDAQITTTLEAVRSTGLPAIVLWPNADA